MDMFILTLFATLCFLPSFSIVGVFRRGPAGCLPVGRSGIFFEWRSATFCKAGCMPSLHKSCCLIIVMTVLDEWINLFDETIG